MHAIIHNMNLYYNVTAICYKCTVFSMHEYYRTAQFKKTNAISTRHSFIIMSKLQKIVDGTLRAILARK